MPSSESVVSLAFVRQDLARDSVIQTKLVCNAIFVCSEQIKSSECKIVLKVYLKTISVSFILKAYELARQVLNE